MFAFPITLFYHTILAKVVQAKLPATHLVRKFTIFYDSH